ncbi:MAG: stage II sporulation protein M [Thaumarchaeota archaeon]|nr:stage II sporulation protein M [Nitrososphaerota archaeon]MDE1867108.1 stage II sporulation protein M [Nitrososphaerota archaeon]
MSKKKRIFIFGIFLGIFLLAYTVGTWYRMPEDDARKFLKEFHSTTKGIGAIGIFLHNSSVALPMFVPGFGVAWGAFTGWETGAGFRVLMIENPQLSNLPPIAIFLSSPFGVMELVAYSIGMSRSCLLVLLLIRRKGIRVQMRAAGIEIGIVLALLLVGGFVEYGTIHGST